MRQRKRNFAHAESKPGSGQSAGEIAVTPPKVNTQSEAGQAMAEQAVNWADARGAERMCERRAGGCRILPRTASTGQYLDAWEDFARQSLRAAAARARDTAARSPASARRARALAALCWSRRRDLRPRDDSGTWPGSSGPGQNGARRCAPSPRLPPRRRRACRRDDGRDRSLARGAGSRAAPLWPSPLADGLDPVAPAREDARGPPILVVPSLINGPQVLDLSDEVSLLARLVKGRRPVLVDWGQPGPEERGFDLVGLCRTAAGARGAIGWPQETGARRIFWAIAWAAP